MLYRYIAIDHCTGRRIISQGIARSTEHLATILRSVYGAGLEIISMVQVN